MYKLEKKNYGVKITFAGAMTAEELMKWISESRLLFKGLTEKFGVSVDMRGLKPLPGDAQKVMEEGQKMYKSFGMERSVVILANPIITAQFKRIAKETGIYQWERYIDSSKIPNWEDVGTRWLVNNIDPDLN